MSRNTGTKNSFVAGAAILGIAGLIVKVIGAVYRIPLANIVGDEGMAYYEVAYPYYSWLLVISSAGLPTAVSKLVSERIALNDSVGAKRVFRSAMRLLFCIGIVTTFLLFALSGSISSLSGVEQAKYSLMALSPALFFVSIMCAYRGYLQGMQCMTGTALSQIVEQLIKLAVGFSLAFYFTKTQPSRPELAAMGALIGVSVSELTALIVIKIYYEISLKKHALPITEIDRRTGPKRGPTMRSITKKLLLVAIPITIGASIMPITGIADSVFIVNILKSNGINGINGFAEKLTAEEALSAAKSAYTVLRSYVTPLINMPAVLTLSLSMSLVPAISQAVTQRDMRTLKNAGSTGLKLAMFIGAPCAAGLFVVGGPIMAMLYTAVRSSEAKFAQAQKVMYIAAIGVLFLSLVQTLTGIIQGMGKPRIPVYFLAIGGAVKVISMILLMKFTNLGILGAALSTVLCYACAGIADTVYFIKTAKLSISYLDAFVKPILSSVVMGIAVWGAYSVIVKTTSSFRIATLLSICVGIVVYAAAMLVLRPFNSDDFDFIPKGEKLKKLFKVTK